MKIIWEDSQRSIVVIEQFFAVERDKTLKNAVADATRTDSANHFTLQVESVSSDIWNLPITTFDHLGEWVKENSRLVLKHIYLVCRGEVPDEEEDRHHYMLGYRYDIRPGNLWEDAIQCFKLD